MAAPDPAASDPAQPKPLRVLAFGTYDASTHPRVAVLIEGLRAHGVDVRECNHTLGMSTAARVRMLRRPWTLPLLAVRVLSRWVVLARQSRRLLAGGGPGSDGWAPDAVLVGYLGHFDVLLARVLFGRRGIPLVLDHLVFAADTARDRGQRSAVLQMALRMVDRTAMRCADMVLVDTEEHRLQVPASLRQRAVVVPVGAGSTWFRAARATGAVPDAAEPIGAVPDVAPRTAGEPLTVVFFGLFTPLQGAPVIGAALAAVPQPLAVTLVGGGQDEDATRAALAGDESPHTVTWLPWVPAEQLPDLVASHAVCLGIFGDTPKALNVVPTKVFQGAAAGCALVTSDTPPQRRLLGSSAELVPVADPVALAGVLSALARDPDRVTRLRAASRALAATHADPATVVVPLLSALRHQGPLRAGAAGRAPTLPPLAPGAALRWDVVRRLLRAAGGDLLEVGCGQGAFAVRLAQQATSYVGVEPDPVSFAVAAERMRRAGLGGSSTVLNTTVLNTTVEALEPGRTFDVVCAFEVLEHLEDDAAALAAWAARLRPGGLLLISMPAHAGRLGPWDELVGHYRRYDPAELPALLARAGLVGTSVHLYGYPVGAALEAVRNRVARRRLAGVAGTQADDRTASSGRQLQPRGRATALAVAALITPFLHLQHRFPGRGIALVVTARKPVT